MWILIPDNIASRATGDTLWHPCSFTFICDSSQDNQVCLWNIKHCSQCLTTSVSIPSQPWPGSSLKQSLRQSMKLKMPLSILFVCSWNFHHGRHTNHRVIGLTKPLNPGGFPPVPCVSVILVVIDKGRSKKWNCYYSSDWSNPPCCPQSYVCHTKHHTISSSIFCFPRSISECEMRSTA